MIISHVEDALILKRLKFRSNLVSCFFCLRWIEQFFAVVRNIYVTDWVLPPVYHKKDTNPIHNTEFRTVSLKTLSKPIRRYQFHCWFASSNKLEPSVIPLNSIVKYSRNLILDNNFNLSHPVKTRKPQNHSYRVRRNKLLRS